MEYVYIAGLIYFVVILIVLFFSAGRPNKEIDTLVRDIGIGFFFAIMGSAVLWLSYIFLMSWWWNWEPSGYLIMFVFFIIVGITLIYRRR